MSDNGGGIWEPRFAPDGPQSALGHHSGLEIINPNAAWHSRRSTNHAQLQLAQRASQLVRPPLKTGWLKPTATFADGLINPNLPMRRPLAADAYWAIPPRTPVFFTRRLYNARWPRYEEYWQAPSTAWAVSRPERRLLTPTIAPKLGIRRPAKGNGKCADSNLLVKLNGFSLFTVPSRTFFE